jgi:hypothetical protein
MDIKIDDVVCFGASSTGIVLALDLDCRRPNVLVKWTSGSLSGITCYTEIAGLTIATR